MLRSRLEARIDSILSSSSPSRDSCQELNRVLELVKKGEALLNQISEKVDSARYLQEFIQIVGSATSSINEIKGDIEQLAPKAEAALSIMHDAIGQVSMGLTGELKQEIDPSIFAQISSSLAPITSDVHSGGFNEEAQRGKSDSIEPAIPKQVRKEEEIEERLPA
jgi:hypothetical protein